MFAQRRTIFPEVSSGQPSETFLPSRRKRGEESPPAQVTSSPPTGDSSLIGKDITPPGWRRYAHPGGGTYFVKSTMHSEDSPYFANTTTHVVTPDRPEKLGLVDEYSATLLRRFEELVRKENRALPADWELWIRLQGTPVDGYDHGFIDHSTQAVYHVYGQEIRVEGKKGYWLLFSRMPVHHPLYRNAVQVMLSALANFATERILINEKSKSPFKVDQCERLVSLFKTLDSETLGKPETAEIQGVRNCALDVHVMVEPANPKPPSLGQRITDAVLLILCFGAHDRYRRLLQRAHSRVGLHVEGFQKALTGEVQEWQDSNLLSTVFILANVGFLALPDIQETQETASLLSIMFSMASIVMGTHHVLKHQPRARARLNEIRLYLSLHQTVTAVFLSLPLVCLLWSIFSFSIALLHFSFKNHHGVSQGFLALVAAVMISTIFCVRVFFYRIWDDPDETSVFRQIRKAVCELWEAIRKSYEEAKKKEEARRQQVRTSQEPEASHPQPEAQNEPRTMM